MSGMLLWVCPEMSFEIVTLKGSRFAEDEDPFRVTNHLGYSWTDPLPPR
jgi:hypothetical protein